MGQHRIGHIGIDLRLYETEQGMQRTVGVPQREGSQVGESLRLFDILVQPAEPAVGILEDKPWYTDV